MDAIMDQLLTAYNLDKSSIISPSDTISIQSENSQTTHYIPTLHDKSLSPNFITLGSVDYRNYFMKFKNNIPAKYFNFRYKCPGCSLSFNTQSVLNFHFEVSSYKIHLSYYDGKLEERIFQNHCQMVAYLKSQFKKTGWHINIHSVSFPKINDHLPIDWSPLIDKVDCISFNDLQPYTKHLNATSLRILGNILTSPNSYSSYIGTPKHKSRNINPKTGMLSNSEMSLTEISNTLVEEVLSTISNYPKIKNPVEKVHFEICSKCTVPFTKNAALKAHLSTHSIHTGQVLNGAKTISCSTCKLQYPSKFDFIKHLAQSLLNLYDMEHNLNACGLTMCQRLLFKCPALTNSASANNENNNMLGSDDSLVRFYTLSDLVALDQVSLPSGNYQCCYCFTFFKSLKKLTHHLLLCCACDNRCVIFLICPLCCGQGAENVQKLLGKESLRVVNSKINHQSSPSYSYVFGPYSSSLCAALIEHLMRDHSNDPDKCDTNCVTKTQMEQELAQQLTTLIDCPAHCKICGNFFQDTTLLANHHVLCHNQIRQSEKNDNGNKLNGDVSVNKKSFNKSSPANHRSNLLKLSNQTGTTNYLNTNVENDKSAPTINLNELINDILLHSTSDDIDKTTQNQSTINEHDMDTIALLENRDPVGNTLNCGLVDDFVLNILTVEQVLNAVKAINTTPKKSVGRKRKKDITQKTSQNGYYPNKKVVFNTDYLLNDNDIFDNIFDDLKHSTDAIIKNMVNDNNPVHKSNNQVITRPLPAADWTCLVCQLRFQTQLDLVIHGAKHMANHSFMCFLCNMLNFSSQEAYNSHLHTYHKSVISCFHCTNTFMTTPDLLKHLYTAFNIPPPIKCSICNLEISIFAFNSNLTDSEINGDKLIPLTRFPATNDGDNSLKIAHISKFHPNGHGHTNWTIYPCWICQEACFSTDTALKTHLLTYHSEMVTAFEDILDSLISINKLDS